jgi:hypothetical protein
MKVCLCSVCEFGPGKSAIPAKISWDTDMFCSIGRVENDDDSGEFFSSDYVSPRMADTLDPSVCPRFVQYQSKRIFSDKAA